MASGKVTAIALNLRTGANGSVITVLRQGCLLNILAQQAGWLNVTTTQDNTPLQGWVSSSYVAQTPSPVLPSISERAAAMIVGFEVTSEANYNEFYAHPTWPEGDSGITIGIGYDLGYVSEQDFRADFSRLIPEANLASLAALCGTKGEAAYTALPNVSDITIPWSAAIQVFRSRSLPETTASTIAALPRAAQLNGDCLGAVVSLVYNRGCSFNLPDPRHREMRAIRDDIAQGKLADIPSQLRSMCRLWAGKPGMEGLVARRKDEASLFEGGLAEPA